MNLLVRGNLHYCIYAFLLIVLSGNLSAQKNITLTFNESGKLISEPLPRFIFSACKKNCADVYQLRARVLLPVDYFKEEKDRVDSMALETYSALKDHNSTLYRILACGKELATLNSLVNNSPDVFKWNFSQKIGDDTIVPGKLKDYVQFMRLFGSLSSNAGNSTVFKRLLGILNTNYLEFSPFRLRVKGYQIEDKCMQFTAVRPEDNYCHCILPGKKYIAVEFGIPRNLITEDMALDSFQVVQYFVMKKYAVEQYNIMLSKHKPDLEKLKALQKTIKENLSEMKDLLDSITGLENIKELCVGEERVAKGREAEKKVAELKAKLEKKLGKFDCDTPCTGNLLLCSNVLSTWILKLVWLNGDLIRLNPFNFTNQKIVIPADKPAEAEKSKPLTESELALAITDDSITIAMWNATISHFQDSALRDKKITIDSVGKGTAKMLAGRDSAQKDLDAKKAERKKTDQNKSSTNNANANNADQMASFLTVSKVRYKGWLVPYKIQSKIAHDRMWLRNYYYDGISSLTSDDKFKFTYPEDENLALMVHNLKPGMSVNITESIVPGTDSSEWNIFAADAIKQLSQLYASVQPVAGIVRNALKSVNTVHGEKDNKVMDEKVNLQISNVGYQLSYFTLKSPFDSAGIRKLVDSNILHPGANVIFKINNSVGGTILSFDSSRYYKDIKNAILNFADTATTTSEPIFKDNDACDTRFLKSLIVFASAPDLIDEPLKTREDSIPSYFTYHYTLADSIPTYINRYSIRVAVSAKADSMKTSSFIKVAPYHYFSLAAGIAYTPKGGSITSIDTSGGGFKIDRDDDKVRLIVGFRYYPMGLYNLKNPVSVFREYRWLHRLSVLVATGIPAPLHNIYGGVGLDVFAGLTLSAGIHFQQQNEYEIQNNQIKDRSVHYRGEAFYSITMDPTLFISAVTSIFKK